MVQTTPVQAFQSLVSAAGETRLVNREECNGRLAAEQSLTMTGKVFKNAAIGATSASAAVLLLFAIRRDPIDVPYVWAWAMLAAICYGWLAVGLSIYGQGSVTPSKWKNGLLGIAILVGVELASLITDPFIGAAAGTSIAVALAVLISMAVSDALA